MSPRAERMAESEAGPVLQGIRCRDCAARSFPPARFCRSCHSTAIDVVPLAQSGRIEAIGKFDNTAFGEIRLTDGLLVAGRIDPAIDASIGRHVRFAPQGDIVRFEVTERD